jgi:hypothetical protein
MGHYAEVKEGIVTQVIVAKKTFIDTLPNAAEWIKTSYNTRGGVHYNLETYEPDGGTPLRKNFAGVGFIYDAERDAFYEPQPYPDWVFDEESCTWKEPDNTNTE